MLGSAILQKRDPVAMRTFARHSLVWGHWRLLAFTGLARDFMNDHYFHRLIIEKRGMVAIAHVYFTP